MNQGQNTNFEALKNLHGDHVKFSKIIKCVAIILLLFYTAVFSLYFAV